MTPMKRKLVSVCLMVWLAGLVGCAPEVAHLQVSGAFTLDNTDRALAALAASFAVQVHYRTRYWVRVEAA